MMTKIVSRGLPSNLIIPLLLVTQVATTQDIYTEDNTLKRTLANGMTVVIHEIHKTPIISIEIGVKTGSATEGRFLGSGISHIVEHMLFKGNGKKNTKSYTERIKSLGGYINGYTSHEYTGYSLTAPKEYASEALWILKDIVVFPVFDALELKKEKEVILNEIRKNIDEPRRLASDLTWNLTFKERPYKYPIIGYEDLFERIEKSDLEEYYSERYSPNNIVLVICGDVTKETFFKEVENIFGDLKRNFIPTLPSVREPVQLNQRRRTEYRPVSLAHVILSFRSASISDPALYPLDILAIALGEGEDSILTKELRDRGRYVNYITCHNYTLQEDGLFYIYFTAEPSKINDAVSAIMEELEKIKKSGLIEDNLQKSKKIARADFINALETTEGRGRDIITNEMISGDYNLSHIYLNKLLEVTAEEVKSAASAYLKTNSLNMVSILPEGCKTEARAPEKFPQSARIMIKEVMPNGMRVVVCEDHSTPSCSVSALFLGGVRVENDTNNGVMYLVSKLLLDGTKTRSEEQIKSEIEAVGGSINTISGNNSFGIMLNFHSEDWKRGIDITSDIIMNSVFSSNAVEKEKALALAAIKERDDDIVNSGLLLFKQNFFKEHPYRFDPLGTADTIQNLNRDDIASYYKSLGVSGNMILTITGDINAGEVIREVEKSFIKFEPAEPELPKLAIPKIPTEKKEVSISMEREQSLIIVGFPSVRLDDSDRYIFEVIDSIMSGSNGRMFNIRDALGMSYALGSLFQPGLEPGYHLFYALTSKRNIKTIKDAILDEIGNLKNTLVSEEELEAAKRCLITSFMTELQKNSAFGLRVSFDELYGLGYKNFETYYDNINSVTATQIKRAVNQYFKTDNSIVIIIYGNKEELEAL